MLTERDVLQREQEASKCVEEVQEASKCVEEVQEASKCVEEVQEASKCVEEVGDTATRWLPRHGVEGWVGGFGSSFGCDCRTG